ncbi:acyltransferase [Pseudonocardia sp. DSM 110487]|uniref:acyltransferase family protein n=1 Tax=Pseudonocardia sp. DSM 110487 TaxID=2865833 RepID=UPI001C6A8079|nr:acyltransferase [Pseudonocardia sp. DSM 110487]QYN32025.1 acyltransferase [Pseudonocardia sp. DSM 110487]
MTNAPTAPPTAAGLATATPVDRDRYADLLRLFSIGMVVLGHWVVALLTVHGAGGVTTSLPLMLSTWVWQVMALFFFVGGFAHARALRHRPASGRFIRARLARLLPPVLVMLAVWTALAALMHTTGYSTGQFAVGLHMITVPLWFVGVYLVIVPAAPAMMRLHERFGLWPVLAALTGAVVVVDALRMSTGETLVGYANYLFVWLAVHQLGYGYADGTLQRGGHRLAGLLAGGGLAGAALLVFGTSAYPVLMVGLPGNDVSNSAPPNLALLAQSLFLVGTALLLRRAGTALMDRPRAWFAVATGSSVIMTVFCWHLTACYLVQGLLLIAGVRLPAADTVLWFPALAGWLIACSLACLGIVALFRRFERPADALVRGSVRTPIVVAGTLAVAVGLFVVSKIGLHGLVTEQGLPGAVLLPLALVAAGVMALRGR